MLIGVNKILHKLRPEEKPYCSSGGDVTGSDFDLIEAPLRRKSLSPYCYVYAIIIASVWPYCCQSNIQANNAHNKFTSLYQGHLLPANDASCML